MPIKKILSFFSLISFLIFLPKLVTARERFFQVQSIDTMKYSRDLAREKIADEKFAAEIDLQVKNIAETGATHVSVGTPYDAEFLPFLKRWVQAARKNKLNVWFRGNLAGWEKWFEYPKISREIHILKTKEFILKNPDLFEDGDVFTSCPECENGGSGDPRQTKDIEGFRNFLKEEYKTTKEAFRLIGKNVIANFYSMNGDVARLIMDEEMTKALDGAVTIDHYVKTPDQLVSDAKQTSETSKGKIVLGEFGVPIPDIHGALSEQEQARWIDEALKKLIQTQQVIAVNYWTNRDSSTELWNIDNSPRLAVSILSKYFNPINEFGAIKDQNGQPLKEVTIKGKEKIFVVTDSKYSLPVLDGESVTFSKLGYVSVNISVIAGKAKDVQRDIILAKSYHSPIYSFFMKIINFFKSLSK